MRRPRNRDWMEFRIARHERADSLTLARLAHTSDEELDALTTPDARRFYNMAREVASDCHLTISYIRFKLYKDRVLWAEAKPKHKVEDMVMNWLRQRYKHFGLVLFTQRGVFACWPGGDLARFPVTKAQGEVLEETACHVPEKAIWWDDQGDGLWDTFYNSQYISSRKNLPLFYKTMPKYYLENFSGLSTERRRVENGTLDAYTVSYTHLRAHET